MVEHVTFLMDFDGCDGDLPMQLAVSLLRSP